MASYLPTTYQPTWNSSIGQQMYPQYQQSAAPAPAPQQQPTMSTGIKWVDGEVGAKAYQMPSGWPANQPIALWDTNDTIIYLKSINPMGMPNPLQKAHYTLEEHKSTNPMSGRTEPEMDMSQYVRKEDVEKIKKELMDAIDSISTGASKHGKVE